LASQAIKDVLKAREEKAAAEAEAKRLAERAALEERASTAESESARIARQLKEVELQRQALAAETADLAKLTEKLTAEKTALAADRDAVAAERDRVAADREAIRKERDELASRLKGALSSVAETTETARGVVVSLSGILFDVGKATLMPASQVSVAKLAGILTVFAQMNLSIEGYTDSTGSLELNMRLSTERARTVYEFLLGQGIAADRMKYQGFGPENPVAPNDAEANRSKNRRVEVVLTQAVR
jgi:outer membrane protein OmpA-like peptidoglycan-associated protein